jgi:hypothetical protein
VGLLLVARAHAQRPRGAGGGLAYLLLLATCAGVLAAAVVRWNPQWSMALALPGAAVLAAWLRSGGTWSTPDRTALAVAVGTSLPNALGSFHSNFSGLVLGLAVSLALGGLVMVGTVLLRALPLRWALASWLLGVALVLEPLPPDTMRIKALLLVLALLWLLPKAPLPAAAHRRPPHPQRPTHPSAYRRDLALATPAHHRVRPPGRAAPTSDLTTISPITTTRKTTEDTESWSEAADT